MVTFTAPTSSLILKSTSMPLGTMHDVYPHLAPIPFKVVPRTQLSMRVHHRLLRGAGKFQIKRTGGPSLSGTYLDSTPRRGSSPCPLNFLGMLMGENTEGPWTPGTCAPPRLPQVMALACYMSKFVLYWCFLSLVQAHSENKTQPVGHTFHL